MTSRSRSVSAFSRGDGAGSLTRAANSAISRRVTLGDSSASPAATARTAVDQLDRLGVLDEEAARSAAQRLEHVLVQLERGEDDDPDAVEPVVGGDPPGGLQPVQSGH